MANAKDHAPETPTPEASPPAPDSPASAPEAPAPEAAPPPRWRSGLRRRLALFVLVAGVAVVVAYWSRGRPVEVLVIYDFGQHAPRVSRVELSYEQEGKEAMPVELDFPSSAGAPRRWRHTLKLHPGDYTVRARVHLRPDDGHAAEVKRHSRRITVRSGEEQRLVLRLAR